MHRIFPTALCTREVGYDGRGDVRQKIVAPKIDVCRVLRCECQSVVGLLDDAPVALAFGDREAFVLSLEWYDADQSNVG